MLCACVIPGSVWQIWTNGRTRFMTTAAESCYGVAIVAESCHGVVSVPESSQSVAKMITEAVRVVPTVRHHPKVLSISPKCLRKTEQYVRRVYKVGRVALALRNPRRMSADPEGGLAADIQPRRFKHFAVL